MAKALIYVVPFALALYALIDLSRSEPAEHADLTRWGWVAVIVLFPVVGPIAWVLISRARRGGPGALRTPRPPSSPGGRPRPARRPGPLAPDDDPDFLWRLEQDRRRKAQGEGPEPTSEGGPGSTDPTVGG